MCLSRTDWHFVYLRQYSQNINFVAESSSCGNEQEYEVFTSKFPNCILSGHLIGASIILLYIVKYQSSIINTRHYIFKLNNYLNFTFFGRGLTPFQSLKSSFTAPLAATGRLIFFRAVNF